jgi:hypothetical protein
MNKRVFVFFAVLTLTATIAALAQAPAAQNRAATEKQILTMERAINEAIAKGDMKSFHSIVAADAVGVDSGGITKASGPEFDKMMSQAKIQTWNIDGSQFYWIDDNAVLHMYRWTGKGTFSGQPIPSPVWSSTVWASRGGKWTATFHQETTAMAPPPATAPASSTPGKK